MKISLPISILKPLINSLSPSKRSKGARFLSIKEMIIHKINQNVIISNSFSLKKILNPLDIIKKNKKTKIKVIS